MELLCLGCSGFIGQAVRNRLLESGHSLLLVSRNAPYERAARESWVSYESDWMDHLVRVDGIVNFAGEPIAGGHWTTGRRWAIEESRAGLCRKIVDRLGHLDRIPKIWINASAVGYYGDQADQPLLESSPRGHGFLAQVCHDWESEVARSAGLGVREIRLRLGVVLDRRGGMLKRLLPIYRAGFGGVWGKGTQYLPWVSLEDVVRVVDWAVQAPVRGPVNVVAPEQLTQREFSQRLAAKLGRSHWMRTPAWLLRLLLGDLSEMLLNSQRVVPQQLQKSGFEFRKPSFEQALAEIL